VRTSGVSEFSWRDCAAYAPLLQADRSLFAWEWLRRTPGYRAAADGSHRGPASAFGLVAFEPPGLAVPAARPLWRAEEHPLVLPVEPAAGASDDIFHLEALRDLATLASSDGTEHLLLTDGLRVIRLDAPRGTFGQGRLCLRYRVEGLARADMLVLTLRRFLALARTGRFARSLHPVERRARRWILLLRTFDALQDGAGQREIAQVLFGRPIAARWRSEEPSIRSQAQRLVRSARALAAGGYRQLLAVPTAPGPGDGIVRGSSVH
jgi:hypothetical protein